MVGFCTYVTLPPGKCDGNVKKYGNDTTFSPQSDNQIWSLGMIILQKILTKTWEWPTHTTSQYDELTPYTARFSKTPKTDINHILAIRRTSKQIVDGCNPDYPGKRPQTVCSSDSKGKGGKDLKSSVAASYQDQSDPSSEKTRYQITGQLL